MKTVKDKQLFSKKQAFDEDHEAYDHYFAIDWSMKTVAVAHMSASHRKPKVVDMEPDVYQIHQYLSSFSGRKILTLEETTTSHWLYVELRGAVNRVLICDPYRNALLGEGAKTDRIDARKLCLLLRAGLLKEVYHSYEVDYWIRKMVKSYLGLVKSGVRIFNQKSALYRALGLRYKHDAFVTDHELLDFVAHYYEKSIEHYQHYKQLFEQRFARLVREHEVIGYLQGISGLGPITSVMAYALILDAHRFRNKYHFGSYCGLVRHEKFSGGRSYGKRRKENHYNHQLKFVFKSAALAAIGGHNDIREYYEYLLSQGYPPEKAQHRVSRYIATSCYAVMKHKSPYRPYQWRKGGAQRG